VVPYPPRPEGAGPLCSPARSRESTSSARSCIGPAGCGTCLDAGGCHSFVTQPTGEMDCANAQQILAEVSARTWRSSRPTPTCGPKATSPPSRVETLASIRWTSCTPGRLVPVSGILQRTRVFCSCAPTLITKHYLSNNEPGDVALMQTSYTPPCPAKSRPFCCAAVDR